MTETCNTSNIYHISSNDKSSFSIFVTLMVGSKRPQTTPTSSAFGASYSTDCMLQHPRVSGEYTRKQRFAPNDIGGTDSQSVLGVKKTLPVKG